MVADCWCSVGKKKEGKKTHIEPGGTLRCMVTIHPGFWGTFSETRLTSLLFNFSDFFSIFMIILFRIGMFVDLVSDHADEEWQHCCRWSSK
jgi:hypothetical protein